MDEKGITRRKSGYSVKETIDRFVGFLKNHGATIYARIDQQGELHHVGIDIKPLEFLLFGNPASGGPVMVENPVVALDLPLKIIAWEDAQGEVWIAYNQALYLEDRHSISHGLTQPLNLDAVIAKVLADG
jgi:uncharacterized protein (DUF302 family)